MLNLIKNKINKVFSYKISLLKIIGIIYVCYSILFIFIFIYLFNSEKQAAYSAAYGILISVSFLGAILLSVKRGYWEVVVLMSFFIATSFLPRLIQYSIVKYESMINLFILFPIPWDQTLINSGLSYFSISIIVTLLGLIMGGELFKEKKIINNLAKNEFKLYGGFFVGLLIFSIEYYIFIYKGVSPSSLCTEHKLSNIWIIHFLSFDVFAYLMIIQTLNGPLEAKHVRKRYIILAIFLLIYLTSLSMSGSRGGVFRILTFVFCVLVATKMNISFNFFKWLLISILIAVLSVSVFFIGDYLRKEKTIACGKKIDHGNEIEDAKATLQRLKDQGLIKNHSPDTLRISLSLPAERILDRLGILDYVIGMSVLPIKESERAQYINMNYPIKNMINNLVIGTPFLDAEYPLSQLLPILYREKEYNHVRENFLSEPWTIFGTSVVFFGRFWSYLFLFFGGIMMQLIFNSLGKLFPAEIRYIYKPFIAYFLFGATYYLQMSIDISSVSFVYFTLQISTILLMLFGYTKLKEIFLNHFRSK